MSVNEIGALLVQTNQPSVFTIVAVSLKLTTIVYKINVQRTQISDVLEKLWCVHLLHFKIFTTSLPFCHFLANAILTSPMAVTYSSVIDKLLLSSIPLSSTQYGYWCPLVSAATHKPAKSGSRICCCCQRCSSPAEDGGHHSPSQTHSGRTLQSRLHL